MSDTERPRVPLFAWVTVVAVLATAVPVFVRLPYSVPGLQSLTPQKILVPLVILSLAWHWWRRRTWPRLTPLICTAGGLFLWLLFSVLVNRQYQLTYNARAWSWLAVYFGLLVAARDMATGPRTRELLLRSVFAAVMAVAVIGFVELLDVRALDPFFRLFRPNWLGLGLHGPGGPETVLPLHALTGGQMRLMSTLSNDAGWFLALGAVAFGGFWLFGDRRHPWARGTPTLVAAGYAVVVLALLLTLSRSSILAALIGMTVLTATAARRAPRLRRRALAIAVLTIAVVGLQALSSSVLRTKFSGLASGRAWTTGMVASEPRNIPSDEQAMPAPSAAPPPPAAAPAATPPPSPPQPGTPAAPPAPVATPPQAAGSEQPLPASPPAATKGDASTYGAWSVTQRVLMWRVAIVMVSHHPAFGVGFANFRIRLYEPGEYFDLFEVGDRVGDVQDPHNFFLWIAAAGGLPALVLALLIIGLSLRAIGREIAAGGEQVGLAITLGAIWLTLLVFMGTGFTLMTPVTQAVFALLVGSTAALEAGQHAARPLVAQNHRQA